MLWRRLAPIVNPDISYLQLRTLIGVLGVVLPMVVWVLGWLNHEKITEVDTISEHYFTTGRDVFVVTLASVGILIFFYRTEYLADRVMARLTGLAALGIGLLPMKPDWDTGAGVLRRCYSQIDCSPTLLPRSYEYPRISVGDHTLLQGMHGLALTIFVLGGLYLVFVSFPRTSAANTRLINSRLSPRLFTAPLTPQKLLRNRLIFICGIIMATGISLFALSSVVFDHHPRAHPTLYAWCRFIFESVFVASFAAAWLIKGQYVPFLGRLNQRIQDSPGTRARRVRQVT